MSLQDYIWPEPRPRARGANRGLPRYLVQQDAERPCTMKWRLAPPAVRGTTSPLLQHPEQGMSAIHPTARTDAALHAFDLSLERLGVDYVDLYLIHWPVPSRDLYVETWRALQPLLAQGRARALGVSNFLPAHLDRLVTETGVAPAVNQIEFHPRWQPREIQEADDKHGVVTEAWSPLGQGAALAVSTIVAIADRIGRSPAQVVLRWHLDRGRVVIPKSVTPSRIAENLSVTDFTLPAEDLAMIDDLARADGRIGPDPASFVS